MEAHEKDKYKNYNSDKMKIEARGYDTIEIEAGVELKEAQVKVWNCLQGKFTVRSFVPPLGKLKTYSIALREGGFVNVYNRKIVCWTEDPAYVVFDKWGNPFSKKTKGLLNEPYFYSMR